MTNNLIDTRSLPELIADVKSCHLCEAHLPFGPRPVVQLSSTASLLIIGQAPGKRVHETGIPWDDLSGNRLREWLQLSQEQFYDPSCVAIMPMGFCYPGTGQSGDLPPRKECAEQWHHDILAMLPGIKLTLLIGQYAQSYYLDKDPFCEKAKRSLTERVKQWRHYLPDFLPLPHPSPRNQRWLKKNPWFETDYYPA